MKWVLYIRKKLFTKVYLNAINMKYSKLFILFILSILIIQCSLEDDSPILPQLLIEEEPIEVPEVVEGCVAVETITSNSTGVQTFLAGPQEEGFAIGIKINEHWEASAELIFRESFFTIGINSYWEESNIPNYILGELFSIRLPYDIEIGDCFPLREDFDILFQTDSISCSHDVFYVDTPYALYDLYMNADNRIEIVEFDQAQQQLKAKLQASFVGVLVDPPAFPDSVRFFNIDIEVGY